MWFWTTRPLSLGLPLANLWQLRWHLWTVDAYLISIQLIRVWFHFHHFYVFVISTEFTIQSSFLNILKISYHKHRRRMNSTWSYPWREIGLGTAISAALTCTTSLQLVNENAFICNARWYASSLSFTGIWNWNVLHALDFYIAFISYCARKYIHSSISSSTRLIELQIGH